MKKYTSKHSDEATLCYSPNFWTLSHLISEKPTYSREGSSVSGDEAGVEDHHLVVAVIDGRRLWS